jgi:hypothetical protein
MILKNHIFAAFSIFVFIFCFIVGCWIIAGLVPPLSPSATAEEVAVFYQGNQLKIQFCLALTMSSLAYIIIPMACALGYQSRLLEDSKPLLANAQLTFVTVTAVTVALIILSVATYRLDSPIEITYLLNNLARIGFTIPVSGIVVWMLCVGAGVLSDKASDPIFPRWAGYASLFCAALTLSSFPVVIFQNSSFAWNGLFVFWIALTAAIVWMTFMSYLTIRASITEKIQANTYHSSGFNRHELNH